MSDSQVEQVKAKVDIVEVIGERVSLKKAGRHFKGLCPFHSEKSPSFIVSPERQSFKCFGCQKGGDVFTFLEEYEGMSFLESLEMLAKRVGVTLESYRPTSQDEKKKRLLTAMDLISEYYHFLLREHESGREARDYLKKRGITNESIQKFKIGWAPNSWRNEVEFLSKKKGYREEELVEIGMLIRSEGGRYYERFRGRVMFPLRDHRGVVVGFSGRTLSSEKTEAKYINSPETMIYSKGKMLYGLYENREAIRKLDKIILVEGELDVIPSVQAGVKPTVAIKGSAFTEEQARLISRYTKNVYMALDADEAGKEAIKRAVIIAEKLEMSIRVVRISNGKDPGEMATVKPQAWKEAVEKAELYWDFLLESTIGGKESDGEQAREAANVMVPALASIENVVVRAHYVTKLAKRLGIPEESVYEEIERVRKKKELTGLKETVKKLEQGEATNRREVLEEYMAALLVQNFGELEQMKEQIEEEWFSQRALRKIVEMLKKIVGKKLEIKRFAATLPEELQPVLDKIYLRDLTGVDQVIKEFERVRRELAEIYYKEKLNHLTQKIATMEKGGEETGKLQQEFVEISRKMSQILK